MLRHIVRSNFPDVWSFFKGRENLTPISILASQKIRIFNINAFDPSNFTKINYLLLEGGTVIFA
jgi:hypothetical protein